MKTPHVLTSGLLCLSLAFNARASSIVPLSTAELVQASDAVFRGTVVGMSCYKDPVTGLIYTRTSLHVDEGLKGTFPSVVQVAHRGGQVGNEDDFYGLSPRFKSGGEYLLFVIRNSSGKLHCTQGQASAMSLQRTGSPSEFIPEHQSLLEEVRQLTDNGALAGADVTDQAGQSGPSPAALTGMLGGIASRFLQPDRGEPIPVLIDADSWPAGLTLTQATNAVQQALNAWTAVTSLKFKLESIQSFGQAADQVAISDEKLRIQLHDNYDSITTPNVLGIGGRIASSSLLTNAGWEIGGNVAGNEFRKSVRGYVVLEATNSSMQTLATFAEVLCHEIGHALNMAHSSEVVTGDPVLFNAIMYFQAHADGRGATLGAYDPPVIQQVYPSNTPPFMFNRYLDVTTAPSTPAVAGINEVAEVGFDLQPDTLSVAITNQTGDNGSFSLTGNKILYTPAGFFADSSRLNPAGSSSFGQIFARVSDGVNASPYGRIRVISLTGDSDDPADGIPDYWMLNFFGHADPQAGDDSLAADDADGDGLNNLQEYIAGTDPRNSDSAPRITSFSLGALQFQAKAYELYTVLSSTNLANWTRAAVPSVPTNASLAILTSLPATNITGVISNLPTAGAQMFFRILKVP